MMTHIDGPSAYVWQRAALDMNLEAQLSKCKVVKGTAEFLRMTYNRMGCYGQPARAMASWALGNWDNPGAAWDIAQVEAVQTQGQILVSRGFRQEAIDSMVVETCLAGTRGNVPQETVKKFLSGEKIDVDSGTGYRAADAVAAAVRLGCHLRGSAAQAEILRRRFGRGEELDIRRTARAARILAASTIPTEIAVRPAERRKIIQGIEGNAVQLGLFASTVTHASRGIEMIDSKRDNTADQAGVVAEVLGISAREAKYRMGYVEPKPLAVGQPVPPPCPARVCGLATTAEYIRVTA
jgi:hypothetical protein